MRVEMKCYEWGVSDAYPDELLCLRFSEGQIWSARELTTADFYCYSFDLPPLVHFSLNNASQQSEDALQRFEIVRTGAGILVTTKLAMRLAQLVGQDAEFLPTVVKGRHRSFEQHRLVLPVHCVDAIDMKKTECIDMPKGAQLPIPPFHYLLERLPPHRLVRANLGPILIAQTVVSLLNDIVGFRAIECST